MSTPLLQRIAEEHAAAAEALPSAVVARARRRRALDALLASGLPTTRDENWRYANLRALERVRFAPAAPPSDPAISAAAGHLPARITGFPRYVFVDGVLAPALSDTLDTHASLTIRVLGRPSGDKAPAELDVERSSDAAFALLNDAFATDGVHISLDAPRGRAATASAPTRLELLFLASAPAQQGASYPRVRVDAAPQTRLTLIERHLSLDGDASFVDAALDLHVLEHACVEHHRLQQLGSRAIWLDSLSAHVAAGAAYHLHAFALGAQAARSTLHVRLAGEAAQLGLHAVAAADRQQVLDSYALVEHAAAHTRTEESFRGIAAGRARVGFNGKIIVRPGAHGADSQQSLRGLLAGPDAEIDVRPQLEIYTDDVRCSHGATAGKLDDMMLFYLLTRGIERDTAQRLLKWAFLEDVVSKVDIGELRRQIEASLAGQLKESEALKELL